MSQVGEDLTTRTALVVLVRAWWEFLGFSDPDSSGVQRSSGEDSPDAPGRINEERCRLSKFEIEKFGVELRCAQSCGVKERGGDLLDRSR